MKNLNAIQLKTAALLIVAVLLLGITAISANMRPTPVEEDTNISDNYSANSTVSQETATLSPKEEAIYTVKAHEGAIAVFKAGTLVPVMRQRVPMLTLPKEDKELIEAGVTFASYKDMLFFLENYE